MPGVMPLRSAENFWNRVEGNMKMLRRTFCPFAFSLLSVAVILAQDGGRTERVEFEKGKTSAHFESKVDMMNPHRYLISVKEGQVLNIKLNGKQIHLRLITPGESTIVKLESQIRMKVITEVAKETGDYMILVQCFGYRSLLYKLDIKVK
jgi:hypothetical protein